MQMHKSLLIYISFTLSCGVELADEQPVRSTTSSGVCSAALKVRNHRGGNTVALKRSHYDYAPTVMRDGKRSNCANPSQYPLDGYGAIISAEK